MSGRNASTFSGRHDLPHFATVKKHLLHNHSDWRIKREGSSAMFDSVGTRVTQAFQASHTQGWGKFPKQVEHLCCWCEMQSVRHVHHHCQCIATLHWASTLSKSTLRKKHEEFTFCEAKFGRYCFEPGPAHDHTNFLCRNVHVVSHVNCIAFFILTLSFCACHPLCCGHVAPMTVMSSVVNSSDSSLIDWAKAGSITNYHQSFTASARCTHQIVKSLVRKTCKLQSTNAISRSWLL